MWSNAGTPVRALQRRRCLVSDSEPLCRLIDEHTIRIPRESGLLPCLYVPVAARDQNAIETYVGKIMRALTHNGSSKALFVHAHDPGELDGRLAIWDVPEATVLHAHTQV